MKHFRHACIQIRLPDDQVLIVAAGNYEIAQRGESRGRGWALVPVERVQDVSLTQVPDLDRGVVRGRDQVETVRVEGN